MSGSALSPWAIARDTDIYAKQLAQTLNCPIHVSNGRIEMNNTILYWMTNIYSYSNINGDSCIMKVEYFPVITVIIMKESIL